MLRAAGEPVELPSGAQRLVAFLALRGRTSRSSLTAKFPMARAAAPILSASRGSTRTTIGPGGAAAAFVLSVPAPDMSDSLAVP